MNYFEFYELPVTFIGDDGEVKKKFLENSRKYHPDFYVNESKEQQDDMLGLSTLNTKAFQTLTDFDKRMKVYPRIEKPGL
jgi:molecular chaperone HscB